MAAVPYSPPDRIGVSTLDRHEARSAVDRASEDASDGLLAFADKRAPHWQGH